MNNSEHDIFMIFYRQIWGNSNDSEHGFEIGKLHYCLGKRSKKNYYELVLRPFISNLGSQFIFDINIQVGKDI